MGRVCSGMLNDTEAPILYSGKGLVFLEFVNEDIEHRRYLMGEISVVHRP